MMIYRSKIGIESRGVSPAGSGFLPRSPVYDNDTMMGLCAAQTAALLSEMTGLVVIVILIMLIS